MNDLQFMAEVEQRYREQVLYPQAARRERYLRELEREQAARRPARRPVRWLGNGLVGLGDRLVAMGERLAPRASGATAPHA